MLANEIIERLYTEEGYQNFRIIIKEEKHCPEFKNTLENKWIPCSKFELNSDGTRKDQDISFFTALAALNYVSKFIHTEDAHVHRYML
jgi:hypothetical protein